MKLKKQKKALRLLMVILITSFVASSLVAQTLPDYRIQLLACEPYDSINVIQQWTSPPCLPEEMTVTVGNTSSRGASLSVANNKIVYTHLPNYSGRDTLSYSIVCPTETRNGTIYMTLFDCPDNIETEECYTDPPPVVFDIKEYTRSASEVNLFTAPLVGDVDDCGEVEIIAMNHTGILGNPTYNAINIYRVNKVTNTISLKYSISIGSNVTTWVSSPIAIAKVDGNRYASIFYTHFTSGSTAKTLRKYDFNGTSWNTTPTWQTTYSTNKDYASCAPVIGDIMGNGRTQVVIFDKVIDTRTGTIIANGNMLNSSHSYGAFGHSSNSPDAYESIPVLVDIDGDGILDLVGGDCVYSINLTNFSGTSGNSFTLKRRASNTGHSEVGNGGTAVADIDNCGQLEVIVSRNYGYAGAMYVYNPRTGAVINKNQVTGINLVVPGNTGVHGPSRPFIGDVDGCGFPEIAFMGANSLYCYKYNKTDSLLSRFWSYPVTDVSASTTLTMFDFAQDGKARLVYRGETHLYIIDGSTSSPVVSASFAMVQSPTGNEYPIVADVNGDGAAEIIVTGINNSYGSTIHVGEIRVYASSGQPWAAARPVWNQAAYYSLNVKDDLTIPRFPISQATVFCGKDGRMGTDDDVRPYNGFLMQQTVLGKNGNPIWAIPNVLWTNGEEPTMIYHGDSIVIKGCIENFSKAALHTPIYVTFYKNDSIAGNIIKLDSIQTILHKDESTCFSFTLKNISSKVDMSDIWIRINDKNGVYPYQPECIPTIHKKFILTGFTVNGINYNEMDGETYCDESNFVFKAIPDTLSSIVWKLNGTEIPGSTNQPVFL